MYRRQGLEPRAQAMIAQVVACAPLPPLYRRPSTLGLVVFFCAILFLMEVTQLTVGQYLKLVNDQLGAIPAERIEVVGEIVDYRMSQGKWVNFDLKDEQEEAKISCFMTAYQLTVPIENGMKVKAVGAPKVYPRFGKFSLNVSRVDLVGEGSLAKAYELLKRKLEAEGLFDVGRKRGIPRFPNRIGLITSSDAAAYGDFMRILHNRWGGVEIVHANVSVQGKLAVEEIVEAFRRFEELPQAEWPEVIVLTRGGGSLEDLHAFNDERTARAVFQCKIPVVVGVGHERDESLCDFVADIRASTPSNAAERVVPDRNELLRELAMHTRRMEDRLIAQLQAKQRSIDRSVNALKQFFARQIQEIRLLTERFHYAFDRYRLSLVATRQHIERSQKHIMDSFTHHFNRKRDAFASLERLFSTFDIRHTLSRGFAIARTSKGEIIKSASTIRPGDRIALQFAEGEHNALVQD